MSQFLGCRGNFRVNRVEHNVLRRYRTIRRNAKWISNFPERNIEKLGEIRISAEFAISHLPFAIFHVESQNAISVTCSAVPRTSN